MVGITSFDINHGFISFGQLSGYIVFCTLSIRLRLFCTRRLRFDYGVYLTLSGTSLVRSFVRREILSSPRIVFRPRDYLRNKSLGRRDRFRPKIGEIGAILAIFKPFQVLKIHMPLLGEFSRSSQDLCESDYDAHKSWDDQPNSQKSGVCQKVSGKLFRALKQNRHGHLF